MEITSSNGHIKIHGNIKSIAHYNSLKSEIGNILQTFQHIRIDIVNSISLTSSIIGYFCKIADSSDLYLEVHIKNDALYNLMGELGLQNALNIQKLNE